MIALMHTARRIAKRHNECGLALVGGNLGFELDGSGGRWYPASEWVHAPIVYPVAHARVTPEEVCEWLRVMMPDLARVATSRDTFLASGL